MTLSHEPDGQVTIVQAKGELDIYTAPELRSLLAGLVDGGSRFIAIDLSGCTFLDVTGLGVLVGGLKKAREKGGQADIICGDSEPILKQFRISGLTRVFGIHETRAQAVAALSELAGEAS